MIEFEISFSQIQFKTDVVWQDVSIWSLYDTNIFNQLTMFQIDSFNSIFACFMVIIFFMVLKHITLFIFKKNNNDLEKFL